MVLAGGDTIASCTMALEGYVPRNKKKIVSLGEDVILLKRSIRRMRLSDYGSLMLFFDALPERNAPV